MKKKKTLEVGKWYSDNDGDRYLVVGIDGDVLSVLQYHTNATLSGNLKYKCPKEIASPFKTRQIEKDLKELLK